MLHPPLNAPALSKTQMLPLFVHVKCSTSAPAECCALKTRSGGGVGVAQKSSAQISPSGMGLYPSVLPKTANVNVLDAVMLGESSVN